MSDVSEDDDFDYDYGSDFAQHLPDEFPFNDRRVSPTDAMSITENLVRTKNLLVEKGIWRDADSELETLTKNIVDVLRIEESFEQPLSLLEKWHSENPDYDEAFHQALGEIMQVAVVQNDLSILPFLFEFGITIDHQVVNLFARTKKVESTTILHHAVTISNADTVRRLLEEFGADPNCQDRPHHNTPLITNLGHRNYINENAFESLEVLLEHGADINKTNVYNETPICKAVSQLVGLWSYWQSLGYYPYDDGLEASDICFNIIQTLFNRGAIVSPGSHSETANESIFESIWSVIESNSEPLSGPINIAPNEDNMDARNLIKPKLKELLSILLEHGLDVNGWRPKNVCQHQFLNTKLYFLGDNSSMTLLMQCCYKQWTDLAILLMIYGADPTVMTTNFSDVIYDGSADVGAALLHIGLSIVIHSSKFIRSEGSNLPSHTAYFNFLVNLLNAFHGVVQFEGIQPCWNLREKLGVEFVSQTLNAGDGENAESLNYLLLKADLKTIIETMDSCDANPFDLKFYARRAIRKRLLHNNKTITPDLVEKLGTPSVLHDYVLLKISKI